jgi:hypothetical protein
LKPKKFCNQLTSWPNKSTNSAEKAWQDDWCQEQLRVAKAEWFIPYLERAAKGEVVAFWELHREHETRFNHPMYQLPPGIPLDDQYCRWISNQTAG